eukprot:11179800-Lingulodinium_polyedra.AAC.1
MGRERAVREQLQQRCNDSSTPLRDVLTRRAVMRLNSNCAAATARKLHTRAFHAQTIFGLRAARANA